MSTQTNQPIVTVVVVPRESFNMYTDVVKRIYAVTSPIFKMIIMEGHAPAPVRRELVEFAKSKSNCRIVLHDKWDYPHNFVNQAMKMIDTKYVVFIDNDVEVLEGWLENLIKCAEEEKVGCVHPIYLTVKLSDPDRKIHIAEGKFYKEKVGDKWMIDTIPCYSGVQLKDYPDQNRKKSDFFEWHTVLFSKALIDKVGPLDDLVIAEHMDYALRIEKLGEKIMLEPKAVVAYDYERIWEFRGLDREYMLFRWNLKKVFESNDRLIKNWNLSPESTARRTYFAKEHTARVRSTYFIPKLINKMRRLVGMQNMAFCKEPRPAKLVLKDQTSKA